MLSFEQARATILSNISPTGAERAALLDALGRAVAEDVIALWDMPLCDNSAMDGFAVRAEDCSSIPAALTVIGYLPAGDIPTVALMPGCAIKIMTGAPIPPGCDAVVPFEETEEAGETVTLKERVVPRQHVRFRGEDVAAGQTVIPAGAVIRPFEISMLASFGKAFVPVHRRARVAVLSTGDELVEMGETPKPGQVINSNALSLAAAIREIGAEPVLLGIARDTRESLREKLAEGLKHDALITSAGVSAGDRDLVREILEELGVELLFWKVAIKPGGPTAFGRKGNIPIFALPGNPVSTMVTFEEFVRPALLRMMGHERVCRPLIQAVLANDVRKKPGKTTFIRVQIESREGRIFARSAGDQHTGILTTMLRADALAVLPADAAAVPAGEEVDVHLLRERLEIV